jgi:membrane-associated phospholipid phosphatase
VQGTTRALGGVRIPAGDLWRFGVFFLAPALALVAIALEAAEREPLHLDRLLVPGTGPLNFEPLAFFFSVITVIGGGLGLTALASIPVAYLISRRRYAAAAFIPVAFAGAWVINRIVKIIVTRPRPEYATSPLPEHWKMILAGVIVAAVVAAWPTRWRLISFLALGAFAVMWIVDMIITKAIPLTQGLDAFPSGHAVGSMTLASALIALTWRSRRRWLVMAAGGMFVVIVGVSRIYFGLHYASDIFGGWLLALAWVVLLARLFRSRLQRETTALV